MKNPADKLTPLNLAKQMYPEQVSGFMEAYNDATNEAHGYLLIDMDQNTPEQFRLRASIFPEDTTAVYTLLKVKKKDD